MRNCNEIINIIRQRITPSPLQTIHHFDESYKGVTNRNTLAEHFVRSAIAGRKIALVNVGNLPLVGRCKIAHSTTPILDWLMWEYSPDRTVQDWCVLGQFVRGYDTSF